MTCVDNGKLGFEQLKKEHFDIVIFDFLMPVKSGPEMMVDLKAWRLTYSPNGAGTDCSAGDAMERGTDGRVKGDSCTMPNFDKTLFVGNS